MEAGVHPAELHSMRLGSYGVRRRQSLGSLSSTGGTRGLSWQLTGHVLHCSRCCIAVGVRCATHPRMWRTSSILFLIAQLAITLGLSMHIFFSKLLLYQTFWLGVSQMHMVDFSGTVFLVGSAFCLTELT